MAGCRWGDAAMVNRLGMLALSIIHERRNPQYYLAGILDIIWRILNLNYSVDLHQFGGYHFIPAENLTSRWYEAVMNGTNFEP